MCDYGTQLNNRVHGSNNFGSIYPLPFDYWSGRRRQPDYRSMPQARYALPFMIPFPYDLDFGQAMHMDHNDDLLIRSNYL